MEQSVGPNNGAVVAFTPGAKVCPKCNKWYPESHFLSKTGQPTLWCEYDRAKYRESMKLHHERRRLGISASRGRPSVNALLKPIRVTFTVPHSLLPTIEGFVKAKVSEYIRQNSEHITAGELPLAFEFGLDTNQPVEPRRQAQTPRSAAKKGDFNADQWAFIDSCTIKFQEVLKKATPQLFQVHMDKWEAEGKPSPKYSPTRNGRVLFPDEAPQP